MQKIKKAIKTDGKAALCSQTQQSSSFEACCINRTVKELEREEDGKSCIAQLNAAEFKQP